MWAADKTGTVNGASSTVPFPSLTPSTSGELYVAYSVVANTATAGTTLGFTYAVTSHGNIVAYDTDCLGRGGTDRHRVAGGHLLGDRLAADRELSIPRWTHRRNSLWTEVVTCPEIVPWSDL